MNKGLNAEDYIDFNQSYDVAALNFPPMELNRSSDAKYLEIDITTKDTFVYPVDPPRRDYQFKISQQCFHENTLVCLPTGTGKTFIAGVVILNFYRWFPTGIILFIAHTKALVNQQVETCYKFTLIDRDHVAVLTGETLKKERVDVFKEKRIIFATPQTIQSEIKKKRLDPSRVSLIVIDEAHHARGNHSYSVVMRMIGEVTCQFRVVALSATPGRDDKSIQAVIYNLYISNIVYMDENDYDIKRYQNTTDVEVVTVNGNTYISDVLQLLYECISIVLKPLQDQKIMEGVEPENLSKGYIFHKMNDYRKSGNGKTFYTNLSRFTILLSLGAMVEKLQTYGPHLLHKSILDFLQKKKTPVFKDLITTRQFKELSNSAERLKDVSHPKLVKLGEIIEKFFSNDVSKNSCAIIFTQYRDSVVNVSEYLKQIPGCRCTVFMGKQSAKTKEHPGKLQTEIVKSFKGGKFNTIVATCVGEEGIDIGEVDLIVCYDTQSSPLRTVQRMGRTGRKRDGKVIFLITEGVEEKILSKAYSNRNSVKNLLTRNLDRFYLFKQIRPFDIPKDPVCLSIRCYNDSSSVIKESKKIIEKPFLRTIEKMELEAAYGKRLKFRKFKLIPRNTTTFIISHSSESKMFNILTYNIEEEIYGDIAKMFGHDPNDEKETEFSSSDDELKICVPRSTIRFQLRDQIINSDSSQETDKDNVDTAKTGKKISYMSSSDDDVDDPASTIADNNEKVNVSSRRAYLSSSSDDIVESIVDDSHVVEAKKTSIQRKYLCSSDYTSDVVIDEPESFTTKVPISNVPIQRLQQKYLSSSTDDEIDKYINSD